MSKLVDLDTAVRNLIRPGMRLHLTTTSRAATRAVQRIFRGQQLNLTLIMLRVGGGHAADLVASGLVGRVVAGSLGAVSRHYTGPLPQMEEVYARGDVLFQHWSFLSLTQRLVAGAQGFPFIGTHSLKGSSMAAHNRAEYLQFPNPFGQTESVGFVRALQPHVSIVHALAADVHGNAILVPPLEDGAWGAKASIEGAIVTAEQIVSSEYIKQHSDVVELPSRYVRAVCHVPFGAHPGRFGSTFLPDVRAYDVDDAFETDYFAATKDPQALAAWLEHWTYSTASHDDYLDCLGGERLDRLIHRPQIRGPGPSVADSGPARTGTPPAEQRPPSQTEWMMVLAAREVKHWIEESSYDLLLVGAGLSEVPGTVARELLREDGRCIGLVAGNGFLDFEPVPGRFDPDPSAASMTADPLEIYGVVLGGTRRSALALLGAAQVDRNGNLNSTLVDGKLLTGSGGSNDAASVCDTVVVVRHSPRKLVEAVEYITCPGARVRAVVTDKAVFRKHEASGTLVLSAFVADDGMSEGQAIEAVAAGCGWTLQAHPNAGPAAPPSERELGIVRAFMPVRYG